MAQRTTVSIAMRSGTIFLVAALIVIGATLLVDFLWRYAPASSPIEYESIELVKNGSYRPGGLVTFKVIARRREICPGKIQSTWVLPNDNHYIGSSREIKGFVRADDQWHPFNVTIEIPDLKEFHDAAWVDLDQVALSNCNGKTTLPAELPTLRIPLND